MPAAGGLQPPLLPPLASPEQSARHVVKLAFPDVKEDGAGRGGIPAHLRTAKRSMAAMDSAAEVSEASGYDIESPPTHPPTSNRSFATLVIEQRRL
eukprot:365123-Chlamydomonas_euryale.AAC.22